MMKHSLTSVLILFCLKVSFSQNTFKDSIADFDNVHFSEHMSKIKDKTARENYLQSIQRNYIKNKYKLIPQKTYVSEHAASGVCGNLDFESGNVGGWTISGDFQLMSGTAVDPFGGFPVVYPNGNYSLRLNDNNVNATSCSPPGTKSSFSATATNTIAITTANYLIKVNFAGVVLNFPHSGFDAAGIKIQFYDQSNNLISSPNYTTAYCNPPGTIVSSAPTTFSNAIAQGSQVCNYGQYPVSYYPWQTVGFNLSSYVGQTVKIELSANWCLYQYDWAYAYFDVCCDSTCNINSITNINNVCYSKPYQTPLCSAYPFNTNFQWSGSSTNTTSCELVNSVGSYTVTSNPAGNPTFTVNEIFNFFPTPKISFSLPINSACSNSSSGIPLFASPPGGTFSGPGVTTSSFDPWLVANGTYTITYNYTDSISGCKGSATQTVVVTTCTGINNVIDKIDLFLAPNPFNNEIIIGSKNLPDNAEFILFNTIGQEILRKRLGEGKNFIETSDLPAGLYIYSLLSQNKQVKSGKLVKE